MMAAIHAVHARNTARAFALLGAAAALLILLWVQPSPPGTAGIANYLPLHMALETAAIVIAVMVFAVGWLNPSRALPANVQLLAFCFLGVALLDFTHMLSYRGMPDFVTPSDPEKAINFWLAARLLAAIGILAAVSMAWQVRSSFSAGRVLLAVGAYVVLAHTVFLLYPDWVPRTFIAGKGLTSFKIQAENVLVLLFATSVGVLAWRMRNPCPFNAPALLGAAGLMGLSELFFTMYAHVTDVYNLAGHLYKIGAYYLLYQGLVVETIRRPYADLERSRAALADTTRRLADERERLKNILAGTQAGTWEWNVQTGETIFNERWAEIAGYRLDELQPVSIQTWQQLSHPEDLVNSGSALERHFRGETPYYDVDVRMRHKDGHWVWARDCGAVRSWTADGKPEWMFGAHTDTTAQHRAERRQQEAMESLRLVAKVFHAAQEGILVVDAQHRIVDANPAFEALSGYRKNELVGNNPRMFSSGQQNMDFYAQMYDALNQQQGWQGEVWNRRKSGEVYVAKTSISAVTDDAGHLEHYVAVYADISALMTQRDHFSSLAHFDALTGLPNRRLLEDRLHQAISASQRNGSQLVVCMLDLDGFKAVNDTLGHAEGDRLLVEMAKRMQHIMRARETLARLGGDEFVLLLLEGDFRHALERVLEVVRKPVMLAGNTPACVTASIGVSRYRPGVEDDAQLLREADEALYRAKHAGKNVWVMHDASVLATDHAPTSPGRDRTLLMKFEQADRL